MLDALRSDRPYIFATLTKHQDGKAGLNAPNILDARNGNGQQVLGQLKICVSKPNI